jgi:hypothetical protein
MEIGGGFPMAQDLHPAGVRRCLGCLQWDGRRTFVPERRLIKADAGSEGHCRVKHSATRGSSVCGGYYEMK